MSLGESIAARVIVGIATWALAPTQETTLRRVFSEGINSALERLTSALGPDEPAHFHTLLSDLLADGEISAVLVECSLKKEGIPVDRMRKAFDRHGLVEKDFPVSLDALCEVLTMELEVALEREASRPNSPLTNLVTTKQLGIILERQASKQIASAPPSNTPDEQWTRALVDQISRMTARDRLDVASSLVDREIERAKDCLLKADPGGARSILTGLRNTRWNDCDQQQRFRIAANLGHAAEQNGDLNRAAELYLEAKGYVPESPRARLLEICARLYQGDSDEAFKLAKVLVIDYPNEYECWPAVVFSSPANLAISEIEALIPASIRPNPDVAFAFSRKALSQRDMSAAEKYARIAQEGKPESIGVREHLALVLLEATASGVPGAELSPSVRCKVDEAARLLREIVSDFEKVTDLRMRARMSYNLGTAYLLLGKTSDGERARSLAFQIDGKNPDYIIGYAGLLALRNAYEDALDVLANAADGPGWLECTVLTVEILMKRGNEQDTKKAFAATQRALASEQTGDQISRLLLLDALVDISMRMSGDSELRKTVESEAQIDTPALLALKAKMHLRLGDPAAARTCAGEAARSFGEDSPLAIRRYIAMVCLEAEELTGALDVLRSCVTAEVFDAYALRMLNCALNLKEYRTILSYCGSLRANGIYDIRAGELEIAALEHFDELDRAIAICTEYLEGVSGDLERAILRFHLTALAVKSNQLSLVEKEISKLPSPEMVNPRFGLEMVKLLTHIAPSIEVVDYAYRLFRENPGDANCRLAMTAAVLGAEKAKIDFQEPEAVGPGVAVLLVDDASKDEIWHVVEECPKRNSLLNELGVDDLLGKRLLGKKKDDIIEIGGVNEDAVPIRIASILNKYVYRFQRCMSEPSLLTSGDTTIRKFHLPTKPDGDLDFEPILKVSEKRSEFVGELLKAYREGGMPLGALAHCVGLPTGLVISALVAHKEQINCCRGSNEERITASRAVQKRSSSMVLDTTAIATLLLLDGIQFIEPFASQLCVPQGVYLELQDVVRYERDLEHASGFVGSERGQLVYTKSDPDGVRLNAEKWEQAIDFLDKHCSRVGGLARLELSPEDDAMLLTIFGRGSAGAVAYSLKEGVPIWTDDLLTAAYVEEKKGRRVWTQLVLRDCVDKKYLGSEDYAASSMRLLGSLYDFTWLDDMMAKHSVRSALDRTDPEPWRNLISHLSSERIAAENVVGLGSAVIKLIWQMTQIDDSRHEMMIELLEMVGRRPHGYLTVVGMLNNLDILFGLDVITCARAKQCVSTWLRSKPVIR